MTQAQGPCDTCGNAIAQRPRGWQLECDDCRFARTLEGKGVPVEVVEAIEYEAARCELEYVDNYRAYRVSDNFLKEDFINKFSFGCCGSFESHCIDLAGNKWIIGCNYGH